jgi:diadenylate cyclase
MDIFSLQIQTIKEMLDWRVSLDIILLTLLIFFLYRTIKTTGTGKIFLGILLAAGIFIVARMLDLKGIEWIYSNLSQILLLALIIIFQPELRKIFERAASIKRREIGIEAPKIASVISDAAFVLAKQKRGALIVFPGQDSVKAWTSEGVQLDAQISFPVLMSIFDPNSPGHDGAVVIENGKITSFGVRLPLSDSNKLPQEFGTRHHAGLGLSEVTDTLVLVVSEERGAVTLFYEGMYERIKDKNDLAARIMKHWSIIASHQLFNQKNVPQRKTITQIALSFVLAFIFWSTVVLTQSELKEMIYTVPVDYISMPRSYLIEGETTTEITVNLLGRTVDLNRINPSQLRAVIDLSRITPGEKTIRVNEENLDLPKQVRVARTRPASIQLSIIEMREIDVTIKPQFIGSLPEGFILDSLAVIPERIKVLAPVDSVQQDSITLLTTPIFLETIKANTRIVCNLTAPAKIKPLSNRFPDVEIFLAVTEHDNNLPEH